MQPALGARTPEDGFARYLREFPAVLVNLSSKVMAALGDERMDLRYLRQVNLEIIYEKGKHHYKSLCLLGAERGRNVESKVTQVG